VHRCWSVCCWITWFYSLIRHSPVTVLPGVSNVFICIHVTNSTGSHSHLLYKQICLFFCIFIEIFSIRPWMTLYTNVTGLHLLFWSRQNYLDLELSTAVIQSWSCSWVSAFLVLVPEVWSYAIIDAGLYLPRSEWHKLFQWSKSSRGGQKGLGIARGICLPHWEWNLHF